MVISSFELMCFSVIYSHAVFKQNFLILSFNGLVHVLYPGRMLFVNPFKSNRMFHCYQFDKSIFVLRDVGWYCSFLFKF